RPRLGSDTDFIVAIVSFSPSRAPFGPRLDGHVVVRLVVSGRRENRLALGTADFLAQGNRVAELENGLAFRTALSCQGCHRQTPGGINGLKSSRGQGWAYCIGAQAFWHLPTFPKPDESAVSILTLVMAGVQASRVDLIPRKGSH